MTEEAAFDPEMFLATVNRGHTVSDLRREETTVIGQWTRQHALVGTQQAAAVAAFPIR